MKRFLFPAGLILAALILAVVSRPYSLGSKLGSAAEVYATALSQGSPEVAMSLMSVEMADALSEDFLMRLQASEVPENFSYQGSDARGMRITGRTATAGTRVIWFTLDGEPVVTGDTSVDNLMGSAVLLCREMALENPGGSCPVSGKPYVFDSHQGLVVCTSGHLGDGIVVVSDRCALRRDSVTTEVAAFLEAGYDYPDTATLELEDIYLISDGEYGARGGYRCPDNGYRYYEIRDETVFCPYHEESSPIVVVE